MGRRPSRGTLASGAAGSARCPGPIVSRRVQAIRQPVRRQGRVSACVAGSVLAVALAAAPAAIAAEAWPAAPAEPPAGNARPAIAEDALGDGLATLYYQLQVLQDDVRRLQGVVEEQNYRIERLVQDQRERYVELDRRLVELAQPAGGAPPNLDAPPPLRGLAPAPATERDAYNAAFALVQGASRLVPSERAAAYAEALAGFRALISSYPVGEFTPNAYYWSGEIHLYNAAAPTPAECASPDSGSAPGCASTPAEALELARQAFVQVATLFADNAKLPDALYKLGVVYHRLGDNQRALEYLDRVVAEHPGHTAADLARNYAAELRG